MTIVVFWLFVFSYVASSLLYGAVFYFLMLIYDNNWEPQSQFMKNVRDNIREDSEMKLETEGVVGFFFREVADLNDGTPTQSHALLYCMKFAFMNWPEVTYGVLLEIKRRWAQGSNDND